MKRLKDKIYGLLGNVNKDKAPSFGDSVRSADKLMAVKKKLIKIACKKLGVKSFADLGGVWGVDGGYTFYTLEKYKIEKAFLVDTNFTEAVLEKQKMFPQLTLINANFGGEDTAERIGQVDAVFLFEVLFHQVAPDWDEVLKMYSAHTKHFVIYNPQFVGDKTVRLLDLGLDEYFKNVPHTREEEPYKTMIEKMYQQHPQHNRLYRDIHNIWQWGIINKDLVRVMKELGFEKFYCKNYGQCGNLKNFEGHAFIFKRSR